MTRDLEQKFRSSRSRFSQFSYDPQADLYLWDLRQSSQPVNCHLQILHIKSKAIFYQGCNFYTSRYLAI